MSVKYSRTVDDAWRRLRSLRHNPPDFAARGERKNTFSAALEQSGQFFRAADSVGYEGRRDEHSGRDAPGLGAVRPVQTIGCPSVRSTSASVTAASVA